LTSRLYLIFAFTRCSPHDSLPHLRVYGEFQKFSDVLRLCSLPRFSALFFTLLLSTPGHYFGGLLGRSRSWPHTFAFPVRLPNAQAFSSRDTPKLCKTFFVPIVEQNLLCWPPLTIFSRFFHSPVVCCLVSDFFPHGL